MTHLEVTVQGKFILSGEHTVLRGGTALLFPVTAKTLKLQFQECTKNLRIIHGAHEPVDVSANDVELVFWSVIEKGLELSGHGRDELKGQLQIDNRIPLGAGLGASAALCVAIAKLFLHKTWIKEDQLFSFARSLEDLFHGESSGADVAVATHGTPIRFERKGIIEPLEVAWHPPLYLSYSGQRGLTSECINKVKSLIKKKSSMAEEIDQEMRRSVRLSELALQTPEDFQSLSEAMSMAKRCFERWGLAEGLLQDHMLSLLEAGASAVKPTGSGGGGYVLSLWKNPPPLELGLTPV